MAKERIWTHLAIPVDGDNPFVGLGYCPVGVKVGNDFSPCENKLSDDSAVIIETDLYPGAKFRVFLCKKCKGLVFPRGAKWGSLWRGSLLYYSSLRTDLKCPNCEEVFSRLRSMTFPMKTEDGIKEAIPCPGCHKFFFIRNEA